jgi:hypothetical protein
VVVVDRSFAVIQLLWQMRQLANPVCMIARLRLDAALYEPAAPRQPGQNGRPRKKGQRLPTLEQVLVQANAQWTRVILAHRYGDRRRTIELTSGTAVWNHCGMPALPLRWVLIRDPKRKFKPQALLCTDLSLTPEQIVKWFVLRWQTEVTLHEVRTHLGVETQRQWSDLAIARTTPALLGLFSLVTLLAQCSVKRGKLPVRQAAWYCKPHPTFTDALAVVRQRVWHTQAFHLSHWRTDNQKHDHRLLQRFTEALCYAAQ